MFRKLALPIFILVILALVVGVSRMALTLNIGSGPIALLQNGSIVETDNAGVPASVFGTLPLPSSAGTTLLAIITTGSLGTTGWTVNSAPAGWTRLSSKAETTNALYEIWAYVANPGGISGITFNATGVIWFVHMSEWSNVVWVGSLEASGSANAIAGTTLAPTTTSNVLTANDLALSGWMQHATSGAPVTFTSPGGWTRLIDNGSLAATSHLDLEYQLNPTTGAPLGPTLTSSGTTQSAAGAIVVLKPAPPVADQSAYLAYGSVTVKLNTLDFALIDCPTAIIPGAGVTLSDPGNYPDWTGTITAVKASDIVELRTGHQMQTITATNAQVPNFTSAPYKLTDNPAANTADAWLLENGNFFELENGSGHWLLESAVQEKAYTNLAITSQVGSTSPVSNTTLGELTTYAPALWPGMTFQLVSNNLNAAVIAPGGLYTIQTITITYQGANPPSPVYRVQFGDRIQTLAEWTKVHAV